MPALITDAVLKQAVADVLKTPVAEMKDYWTRIVTAANASAYNEIVNALACRGYSAAQIAAWDRGAEFERDIGLYWCSVEGAMYFKDNEGELLKAKDRREELKTLCITNGGEIVEPEVTDEEDGPVGHGSMYHGYEIFRRPQRTTQWPVRITGN